MFTKSLAFVAASVAFVSAQLTVITPAALVQCQPVQLSWSGGVAPYFPSIIPGNQPGAAALESFAQTSATSMTWIVNLVSGTSVTIQVVDSTGVPQYSAAVTIQSGVSTSCMSSSAVGSSTSGVATSSSGAAVTTTSGAATTSVAATTTSGAKTTTSSVVTSVKSSSTSSGSAPAKGTSTSVSGTSSSSSSSPSGSSQGNAKSGASSLKLTSGALLVAGLLFFSL